MHPQRRRSLCDHCLCVHHAAIRSSPCLPHIVSHHLRLLSADCRCVLYYPEGYRDQANWPRHRCFLYHLCRCLQRWYEQLRLGGRRRDSETATTKPHVRSCRRLWVHWSMARGLHSTLLHQPQLFELGSSIWVHLVPELSHRCCLCVFLPSRDQGESQFPQILGHSCWLIHAAEPNT